MWRFCTEHECHTTVPRRPGARHGAGRASRRHVAPSISAVIPTDPGDAGSDQSPHPLLLCREARAHARWGQNGCIPSGASPHVAMHVAAGPGGTAVGHGSRCAMAWFCRAVTWSWARDLFRHCDTHHKPHTCDEVAQFLQHHFRLCRQRSRVTSVEQAAAGTGWHFAARPVHLPHPHA